VSEKTPGTPSVHGRTSLDRLATANERIDGSSLPLM
jgi:hypothetical protein